MRVRIECGEGRMSQSQKTRENVDDFDDGNGENDGNNRM